MSGGDANGEQISEYIIADQREVASIYGQVVDLIPDMDGAEKVRMIEHIQRIGGNK